MMAEAEVTTFCTVQVVDGDDVVAVQERYELLLQVKVNGARPPLSVVEMVNC
jgi:hypothetical protein